MIKITVAVEFVQNYTHEQNGNIITEHFPIKPGETCLLKHVEDDGLYFIEAESTGLSSLIPASQFVQNNAYQMQAKLIAKDKGLN